MSHITTHFTMTRVRGKTIPVWRVWVPRLKKSWFRGLSPEGVKNWDQMLTHCIRIRQRFTNCLNRARAQFTDRRTREVWIGLATSLRNLNFTKCTEHGCMLEAPIDMSVKAYSDLLRGNAISIKLYPLGHMAARFQIRPQGFHEALEALSNIDRSERSVHAGDRQKAL